MLWSEEEQNKDVLHYTVGNDHMLDQVLVHYDCVASQAHATMLCSIGLLDSDELENITKSLNTIQTLSAEGKFSIEQEHEDCHTAIELYLTSQLGETGKKIHVGRSRNDQVLTALRLYEKDQLHKILAEIDALIEELAKLQIDCPMPGYTHMQKAMPTTISDWLAGFIHALNDDVTIVTSISKLIDRNPLGSGAGFGVPLNIDRKLTTTQLGFSEVLPTPYAQHSRGKLEGLILAAASSIMFTLNKLATDLITFSAQGFLVLPENFCTGSSIMPQKKNPDVLELMRAKYHVVLGNEMTVKGIVGNLISGYNRDVQLTKQPLFESVEIVQSSLRIATLLVKGIKMNEKALKNAMTPELYLTEKAYALVKEGMPFRDAYHAVKKEHQ